LILLFILQHQRAHNDHAALSHSFYDVITNTDKHNREVQSLKTHLLRPGFYYEHIQRWRRYYPDSQVGFFPTAENLTSGCCGKNVFTADQLCFVFPVSTAAAEKP